MLCQSLNCGNPTENNFAPFADRKLLPIVFSLKYFVIHDIIHGVSFR